MSYLCPCSILIFVNSNVSGISSVVAVVRCTNSYYISIAIDTNRKSRIIRICFTIYIFSYLLPSSALVLINTYVSCTISCFTIYFSAYCYYWAIWIYANSISKIVKIVFASDCLSYFSPNLTAQPKVSPSSSPLRFCPICVQVPSMFS